jgi:hypothetical protein
MQMADGLPVNCKEGSTFDGYKGSTGKCYKNVDCSAVVCTDPLLCGPDVLPDYVQPKTVYKVPLDSKTCAIPSLDQIKALCSNNPMPPPEGVVSNYVLTEGYRCVNAAPRPMTIELDTLQAVSGDSVVGTFCIPDVSVEDKETDGNGIVGYWRMWLAPTESGEQDSIPDQTVDPAFTAYAGGVLTMKAALPNADSVCSLSSSYYYYAFEGSFVGTPAATLPPDTRVYFAIYGVPLNKWSCPKGETNITKCAALYQTVSSEGYPYVPVTLIYDAMANYYSTTLTPKFEPCVAYQLTQNAYPGMSTWTTDMLAEVAQTPDGAAVVTSSSTEYLAVQPPPSQCDAALVEDQNDLFVQVACMDSYCLSFGGGAGSKLVIIAWDYVASTSQVDLTTCAGVDKALYQAVKYKLVRQYQTGSPVQLLGPSSPLYVTSDAKYAYFVDVLPVMPLPWTYTLSAYVARTVDDTYMVYEESPCKSRPLKVTILISPYDETFCQSLPPPDPSRNSPSAMWLNHTTGMCEWMDSQANQAAGDYDCAIKRGTFDASAISLVNDSGQCATLQQSYPQLDPNFMWAGPTCDPGKDYDKSVCLTGKNQMRAASCSQTLNMTGGKIVDATQFSERMSNLYKFYDLHYPGEKSATVQAALTDPTAMYKQYYHCGLDPQDPLHDAQWGTVGPCKDPNDKACVDALKTATRTLANGVVEQVCGKTNKCYSWEDVTAAGSTTKAFQQKRQCFPSSDYENAQSPCCTYQGGYKIDLNLLRGACTCTQGSTYSGDYCDVDLCVGKDCVNGSCGWDANASPPRVKCICNPGFYNRKQKQPRQTFVPEKDDWQCVKNKCPTYYDDFPEYAGTNYINSDKTACGTNPFYYASQGACSPDGCTKYCVSGSYGNCSCTYPRDGGVYDDMTRKDGTKISLPTTPNIYKGVPSNCPDIWWSHWKASGECNEELGLCSCGNSFGVTNDNMCVATTGVNACSYEASNEEMCPTFKNKAAEAKANGQYGEVAFANNAPY